MKRLPENQSFETKTATQTDDLATLAVWVFSKQGLEIVAGLNVIPRSTNGIEDWLLLLR